MPQDPHDQSDLGPAGTAAEGTEAPLRHSTGASRGSWRFGMLGIVAVVVVVFVVLLLVNQDVLSQKWAYIVLPFAIVAAAAARVITILKAASESKRS